MLRVSVLLETLVCYQNYSSQQGEIIIMHL